VALQGPGLADHAAALRERTLDPVQRIVWRRRWNEQLHTKSPLGLRPAVVAMLRPGSAVWIGASGQDDRRPGRQLYGCRAVSVRIKADGDVRSNRSCSNLATDSCTGSVGRRHIRGVSIDRPLQLSAAFDAQQNGLRFVTQLRFRPTEC